MRVAIIGAGFTGLSAALTLLSKGVDVSIFEKREKPGGLALGFRKRNWKWSVEEHYHHIFTSDDKILNLAKEVGVSVLFKKPKTSILVNDEIYKFDSPLDVLQFSKLGIIDKLRMGITLLALKLNPFWKPMENISATRSLPKFMGEEPYKLIWEPLLSGKFGEYKNSIPLSWFWARIKKRSQTLRYPKGGFQNLANHAARKISQTGGELFLSTTVEVVKITQGKISVNGHLFDKLIVTLPTYAFVKLMPDLPSSYKQSLLKLEGLGALNLLLILKKPFLTDGTYWLNICDKRFPFISIVEHTNFIDKKYYGNNYLVYIGNYLPKDHPYFKLTKEELLRVYDPYLLKINSNYQSSIINYQLFSTPFAQPVVKLNYSKLIPEIKTPVKNVYLANIQQVYPWDRGTNYAVELGEKVAKLILKE